MSVTTTSRVILAYVSNPGLDDQEYRRVREAGKYLAVINDNIRTGKSDPFEGLDARMRQDLLAYAVFTRENGFTDVGGGDTPVEDSVRVLVRDNNLFRDEELPTKDPTKDFLNVQLVKQLHRMPSQPLLSAIDIDDKGRATVVREDEQKELKK